MTHTCKVAIQAIQFKINIQNENFLNLPSQFHHIQSEGEVLFNICSSKHKKLKDNSFQCVCKLGLNYNTLAILNLKALY